MKRSWVEKINDSHRKQISVAGTCAINGPPVHVTASTILGGFRTQERTKSTKKK